MRRLIWGVANDPGAVSVAFSNLIPEQIHKHNRNDPSARLSSPTGQTCLKPVSPVRHTG
jgi:hypothetical protein